MAKAVKSKPALVNSASKTAATTKTISSKTITSEAATKTVDSYINMQNPAAIKALIEIRNRLKKAVPAAEETIWYNIPTLKYNGKPLLTYAGFTNHCSLVTMNKDAIKELNSDLKDFDVNGTTIHFTIDNVPSVELLKKIAAVRIRQVTK